MEYLNPSTSVSHPAGAPQSRPFRGLRSAALAFWRVPGVPAGPGPGRGAARSPCNSTFTTQPMLGARCGRALRMIEWFGFNRFNFGLSRCQLGIAVLSSVTMNGRGGRSWIKYLSVWQRLAAAVLWAPPPTAVAWRPNLSERPSARCQSGRRDGCA